MQIEADIMGAQSKLKEVETVLETQASANIDRQNAADAQYEEKMAVNNALMVEQNEKIVALQAKVDSLMFASESIDTQNLLKKGEIKTLNKELKELKEETESSSNQLESFKQESAVVSAEVTVLEFNKKELVEEIATLEKDSKVAEEKMQKATTELESKMKEKIALADRTEALNQREEHIKSAYKKAGIKYEPLT